MTRVSQERLAEIHAERPHLIVQDDEFQLEEWGREVTPLRKPVTRQVDFGRGPVAVTLDPSGLITFRERRRRTVFAIPIGAAFVSAVGWALATKRAKRLRRNGL
jgi:hypothetical protein